MTLLTFEDVTIFSVQRSTIPREDGPAPRRLLLHNTLLIDDRRMSSLVPA